MFFGHLEMHIKVTGWPTPESYLLFCLSSVTCSSHLVHTHSPHLHPYLHHWLTVPLVKPPPPVWCLCTCPSSLPVIPPSHDHGGVLNKFTGKPLTLFLGVTEDSKKATNNVWLTKTSADLPSDLACLVPVCGAHSIW